MSKRMRVIYFPGVPQEPDIPFGGVAYYVPSLSLWAIIYPDWKPKQEGACASDVRN